MPKKILLHNPLSPGDVVVMTALARDIHRAYPGEFQVGYSGSAPSLLWNNPNIVKMNKHDKDVTLYRTHYSLVHSSNQHRYHFLHAYIHDFNAKFGTDVKLTEFKPDLHFSHEEQLNPLVSGRYWIIASGGKDDYTTKWWDPVRWQEVVYALHGEVTFVQVGAERDEHPALKGVIDMRGKTSIRELCRLILHSEGVCCVVTCLMHIAAACNKPCVVVAGGREGWWWEAYTRKNRDVNMQQIWGNDWHIKQPDSTVEHSFLHTIGKHSLTCCVAGGCWRSRVEKCEDGKATVCTSVVDGESIKQPKCLTHITSAHVVEAILAYKLGGYCAPTVTASPVKDIRSTTGELEPPVTICTLLYGTYADIHIRNLRSIFKYTNHKHFKLRIGLNEVSEESKRQVYELIGANGGVDVSLFDSHNNIRKYPMMRQMFHDKKNPLDTRWVVWLDDDSHFVEADWLTRLASSINEGYSQGYTMYGKIYFMDINSRQVEWIKSASWYSQEPLTTREVGGQIRKTKVDFCTGGFWAVEAEWLRKYDWPDVRIAHNGGDVMMGEAVHQTGGRLKGFEYGVRISDAPRRGLSEKPAGS